MLYAFAEGLELRDDGDGPGSILTGRFPYGSETQLAPGRFEVFGPRALRGAAVVHLLAGHDYNRPLASTRGGSLSLHDDDAALTFEARIAPEIAGTTHGRDTLALVRSGLAVGLSPGFRVAANGDTVERRSDGLHRTVRSADLFELSIVTRPAYDAAQVEARGWQPAKPVMFTLPARRAYWWR